MKKTKRLVALALAISLTLCACSSSNNESETSSSSSTSSEDTADSYVNPEGEFPIVDEQIELNVMIPAQTNVEDVETNEFTLYYEELTNIKVNWTVVSTDSLEEKVNISLATDTMPDVYLGCNVTQSQQLVYGSQGAFYALNDYIDEYSTVVQDLLASYDGLEEVITMSDGNIYSLPDIDSYLHTSMPYKMWVNQDWLDNLGIEMPTTIEEFEDMLQRFKDEDANGNGDPDDEVPFLTYEDGWNSTLMSGFLFNSFVYSPDDTNYVYLDDGEIQVSYETDAWKEALEWMNGLYEDGLYYNQSFTLTKDIATQVAENEDGEDTLGCFLAGSPVNLLGSDVSAWDSYVAVGALEGSGGQVATWCMYSQIDPTKFVITTECEYPEAAFRWGTAVLDEDIMYIARFGEEDVYWEQIVPGEDGYPEDAIDVSTGLAANMATYIDGSTWSDVQNYCWRDIPLFINTTVLEDYNLNSYKDGDYDTNIEHRLAEDTTTGYIPYQPDVDTLLPLLVYDEEQSLIIANNETIILTYVEEMVARFVTGDASFDDWDDYIAELEAKGLSTLKATYQEAYDSKYGE